MPWQALHVAALAWPASFEPVARADDVQPRAATSDKAATSFAVI
jgi:hypothetical protein